MNHRPAQLNEPHTNSVPSSIRRLVPYRCNKADARIRRAVKLERGPTCESCGRLFATEQLCVHHILETRIFPEHAREPLNMLVLCSRCHSSITASERYAASLVMHFYSALPAPIRQRNLVFLTGRASQTLCSGSKPRRKRKRAKKKRDTTSLMPSSSVSSWRRISANTLSGR